MAQRNPKNAAADGWLPPELEDLADDWPENEPGVPTEEIAAFTHSKPSSIREGLSRKGHYFGLRPRHLPNGRLDWPPNYRERLRAWAERNPRKPLERKAPKGQGVRA